MSDSIKHFGLLVFVTYAFAVSTARADVEGLAVWQPEPGGVSYVVPKIRGVPLSTTYAKWQQKLKTSSVYGKMENVEHVNLATAPETFSSLPASTPDHALVAVVINRPNQMSNKSNYLRTVISSFEKDGNRLFAIPVGLETALSSSDLEQFRSQLNDFDGQLGVGGDDPHPRTYGQKNTARTLGDISFKRDIEQSAYMTEYMKNGKGRVFYICGSMQRAAVADGFKLHDEIAPITSAVHRGSTAPVLLEVVAEDGSELAIAAGATRFQTSNYHHAAVNPARTQKNKQPTSTITAYGVEPDGTRGRVVKALEFPNNTGMAVQFHPEFRGSAEENRMVRYVSTGWKMRGRYSPKAIAECMERRLMSLMPSEAMAGAAP